MFNKGISTKIIFKEYFANEILLEMTKYKIFKFFFVDISDNFVGLITDGKTKGLLLEKYFNMNIFEAINKNYYSDNKFKYV